MKRTKQIIIGLIILFSIGLIFQNNLLLADENSRHLIAVAKGSGKVFLGWRLFGSDEPNVGFEVWRSLNRDSGYSCINGCNKITDSTNYIDQELSNGTTYYYYVRSDQGQISNIAKVTASTTNNYLAFQSEALPDQGQLDGSGPSVGDLDGDGLLDYVVLDISNYESEPGIGTMRLKAIKSDGTMLWDFDTGYYIRYWEVPGKNNDPPWKETGGTLVPFIVYDLNNDDKAEVIARTDNNPLEGDSEINLTYLSIIETVGSNAQVTDRIELPLPTNIALYRESKTEDGIRIVNLPHYFAIAYLDGIDNPPQIIVQEAVHDGERLNAFDVSNDLQLSLRWDFQSITGYTASPPYDRDAYQGTGGSGSHEIPVYDINGDGYDEVFDGSTLLDGNGIPIWTAHRNDGKRILHPDAVSYGDLDPNNPGNEVWFVVEGSGTQGAYLVDANGNTLWEKTGWRHGHDGWVANLTDDLEGIELYGWNAKRNDNDDPTVVAARMYDISGNLIYEESGINDATLNQNRYHSVIQWDADEMIEIYHFDEHKIKNVSYNNGQLQFTDGNGPNISPGYYNLRADIIGDFREEFLLIDKTRRKISIYTNTNEISTRNVSRWENLEYQKTAARVGASYWRYFGPIDFEESLPEPSIDPQVLEGPIPNIVQPPGDKIYIRFAAESASNILAPMRIGSNDGALGGSCIGVPYNPETPACGGTQGPDITCGGIARYDFNIPEGGQGNYIILGRVLAPSGTRDSFWVKMDNQDAILWDTLQMQHSSQWKWDRVSNRGSGSSEFPEENPKYFYLTAGNHTLRISTRDKQTGLDHIVITNNLEIEE